MREKKKDNHFLKIYLIVETAKQKFYRNVLLDVTMATALPASRCLDRLTLAARRQQLLGGCTGRGRPVARPRDRGLGNTKKWDFCACLWDAASHRTAWLTPCNRWPVGTF